MENKTFTRYEIKDEVRRQIYEHEVLISFYDDNGAYSFNEWLYTEGMAAFSKWLEESDYWKDKVDFE